MTGFGKLVTDQKLLDLLEKAKDHVMTPEERDAQRRSFVRGQIWDREVTDEELSRAAHGPPTHRHRKGGLYWLTGYATHSETGEELALYRDVAGKTWVRPRAMFEDGRFERLSGG